MKYFITTKNELNELSVEELWRVRENARALADAITEELADRYEKVTNKTLMKV